MERAAGQARRRAGDRLAGARAPRTTSPVSNADRLDPPQRRLGELAAAALGRRAPAARGASSIRASASASGLRRSTASVAAPGDRGRDPGLEPQLAGGRDAALGRRDPLDLERRLGRREPGVAALSIGVVPACEACPSNRSRSRSIPTQPVTAAARRPSRSIRGPCSMCSSRYAPRPSRRDAQSPARVELDPVLGQYLADRRVPSASVNPASAAGSSVPANAELPNRLRPNRAPSSSAQSTSTSGRGGGSPRPAQARSTPDPRQHAERAVEPAAVGDRVDVGADDDRRGGGVGALEPRPEVAGLVDLGLDPELGEQLAAGTRAPGARPRPSRGAGRRARPRSGRPSSRRSAITRAASIAGASTASARRVADERLREAVGAAAAAP